jgi:hypothetical protein
MWVRGILPKEHHPFYAAGSDMFCPSDIKDEPPPRHYLQEITDELAYQDRVRTPQSSSAKENKVVESCPRRAGEKN